MNKGSKTRVRGVVVGGMFVVGLVAFTVASLALLGTAQGDEGVPENQSYTGAKKCASCHLTQFMQWKKTNHAKAFDNLPVKYKKDEKCLKCHTTGYGTPSGYKDASTKNLAGNTCESCHGPGSEHDKISQKFAKKKKLSEEEDKLVRSTIHKMLPGNVCITCHTTKAHQDHDKYDEEKKKKKK